MSIASIEPDADLLFHSSVYITSLQPYNLDRLLHRGVYDVAGEFKAPFKWTFRKALQKLIGITPEYTLGDKVIAWSVVGYAIVYKFGLCYGKEKEILRKASCSLSTVATTPTAPQQLWEPPWVS